jgi:hypothetical protein
MKIYQYILLFLLISVVCRNYYLFFYKKTGPKPVKNKIEGFESLSNCLGIGYPTDFCKRVPLEACVTNCPVGTFLPKKFYTF